MSTITLSNNSGERVVVKTEADKTVSERSRHRETIMNDGESVVIFTDRTKRISVEIA